MINIMFKSIHKSKSYIIAATRPPKLNYSTMSANKPTLKSLTTYSYSNELKEHYSHVPKVPLYIDGKMVQSETDEWIPVHNPATQEIVSFVPQATQDELEAALQSSQEAFKKWRKVSILTRQKVMFELQRLLREHMDRIAAIITVELGKTKVDAKGDVLRGLRKFI
jgi:delta 1-pyrroline-5-carboxylate dehydrogenase